MGSCELPGFCRRRKRIYESYLRDTNAYFSSCTDDERVRPALDDFALIDALEEILSLYVVYGVERDLERLRESNALRRRGEGERPPLDDVLPLDRSKRAYVVPDTQIDKKVTGKAAYGRYFDWYIDPVEVEQGGAKMSGVDAFWQRYPLLKHAADTVTEHHRANIKLACTRVMQDWEAIQKAFFKGGVIERLEKIRTTGNDFHKGGKQVLILTFATASGDTGRVVYKPSSVEIDCRIVGNTETANDVQPLGYRQKASLTEIINGHVQGLQLPTYVVLPCRRDSVPDSYGYIEFLTHAPELEVRNTSSGDIPEKVGARIGKLSREETEESDWITTDDDQGAWFYYHLGASMAMAMAVSLSDLHVQNVITHRRLPHLIDLEEALKRPMQSIDDTYLPMLLGRVDDPIGRVMKVLDDQTSELRVVPYFPVPKPAACTLYRHRGRGKPGDLVSFRGPVGSANQRALVQGLVNVLAALATQRCNDEVVDWVKQLDQTIARFVPVTTAAYLEAGEALYHLYGENSVESLTQDGYGSFASSRDGKRWFFRGQLVQRRQDWARRVQEVTAASTDSAGKWKRTPFFVLEHPDHAWRDYLNCDVPSFYHRLGSRDLLNSRGDPVRIGEAIEWQNEAMPDIGVDIEPLNLDQDNSYFPERPIDMVVAQLQRLPLECQDPDGKKRFLMRSVGALAQRFVAFADRLDAGTRKRV